MDEGAKVATRSPRGAWTPPDDGSPRPPRRSDRVLGAVLVLLWAACLVGTAMVTTSLVTPDRLREDLAAGRVLDWRVVAVTGSYRDLPWASEPMLNVPGARPDGTPDPDSPSVPGARTMQYTVDSVLSPTRVVDPSTTLDAAGEALTALRTAGVPAAAGRVGPPPGTSGLSTDAPVLLGAVLLALTLVAVVVGPRPTRGSRWFWGWLLFLPLGLGMLSFAVLELLRPGPAIAAGQRPRRGGGTGLLLAVAGGLLVTGLLTALADATHWLWVARP